MDSLLKIRNSLSKLGNFDAPKLKIKNEESFTKSNQIISFLFKQLNNEQQNIFKEYHSIISKPKFTIQLLDSEPGTGKSFLLAILGMSSLHSPYYCVYKTELAKRMNDIIPLSFTVASATMRIFHYSYHTALNVYPEGKTITPEYILYKLWCCAQQASFLNIDIIIIDEYTILNPEHLLLFCTYAAIHQKHIFFVGDRCQQNSIMSSTYHGNMSNYFLLNKIAIASYTLKKSMRCDDKLYNQKLKEYRNKIAEYKGNTRLYYNIHFLLYKLFKRHFEIPETFENVTYFATHHAVLTQRSKRLKAYLDQHNLPYFTMMWNKYITNYSKYSNELYIIKNYRYIYFTKKYGQMPYGEVKIIGWTEDEEQITVQHINSKKYYTLKKETINSADILDGFYQTFFEEGEENNKTKFALWPLYTSTFHNAQGLTVHNDIEICIDGATCESIYVGLSRITSGENLKRIHTSNYILESLQLTETLEDEYYYKISTNHEDAPKKLKYFEETTEIEKFEKNPRDKNLKIKRSIYTNLDPPTESILTKVAKLLVHPKKDEIFNMLKAGHTPIKRLNLTRDDLDVQNEVTQKIISIIESD